MSDRERRYPSSVEAGGLRGLLPHVVLLCCAALKRLSAQIISRTRTVLAANMLKP